MLKVDKRSMSVIYVIACSCGTISPSKTPLLSSERACFSLPDEVRYILQFSTHTHTGMVTTKSPPPHPPPA